MRIFCWQIILLKYHNFYLSKTRKDIAKFVVCCSCGALKVKGVNDILYDILSCSME